jgi:hypothetical protein
MDKTYRRLTDGGPNGELIKDVFKTDSATWKLATSLEKIRGIIGNQNHDRARGFDYDMLVMFLIIASIDLDKFVAQNENKRFNLDGLRLMLDIRHLGNFNKHIDMMMGGGSGKAEGSGFKIIEENQLDAFENNTRDFSEIRKYEKKYDYLIPSIIMTSELGDEILAELGSVLGEINANKQKIKKTEEKK